MLIQHYYGLKDKKKNIKSLTEKVLKSFWDWHLETKFPMKKRFGLLEKIYQSLGLWSYCLGSS